MGISRAIERRTKLVALVVASLGLGMIPLIGGGTVAPLESVAGPFGSRDPAIPATQSAPTTRFAAELDREPESVAAASSPDDTQAARSYSAEERHVRVAGWVKDANGLALSGVRVDCASTSGEEMAMTDSSGRYELTNGWTPGTRHLVLNYSSPGFMSFEEQVGAYEMLTSEGPIVRNATLRAGVTVRGQVVANGEYAVAARIKYQWKTGNRSAWTNGQGRFSIGLPTDGVPLVLRITHGSLGSAEPVLSSVHHDVDLGVVQLARGEACGCHLVFQDGQPITDFRVRCKSRSRVGGSSNWIADTNSGGELLLCGMAPGECYLSSGGLDPLLLDGADTSKQVAVHGARVRVTAQLNGNQLDPSMFTVEWHAMHDGSEPILGASQHDKIVAHESAWRLLVQTQDGKYSGECDVTVGPSGVTPNNTDVIVRLQ